MAIQNRRGNEADFLSSKMLPGEFAVSVDEHILRICFSTGAVRQVALTEDLELAISQLNTTLSGRISDLEGSSNTILQRIVAAESRINDQDDALFDHNNRITTLEARSQTQAGQIASLVESAGTGATDIAGLKSTVSNHTSQITQLSQTSQTHTGQIASLESRTAANTRDIAEMASKDINMTFEVNSAGHLIETVERYDPQNTTFSLVEGRLMVSYG